MSEYAALCTKLRLHSELGQLAADAIEALERQVDLLFAVVVADAEECDRYHRERDEWRHLHEQTQAAIGNRAEIAERERDAAVADNAAWWAFVDNLSDYETFSPAGEGLVEDMLQANHPGAALLARMAQLEARNAVLEDRWTTDWKWTGEVVAAYRRWIAGHEGYTV